MGNAGLIALAVIDQSQPHGNRSRHSKGATSNCLWPDRLGRDSLSLAVPGSRAARTGIAREKSIGGGIGAQAGPPVHWPVAPSDPYYTLTVRSSVPPSGAVITIL